MFGNAFSFQGWMVVFQLWSPKRSLIARWVYFCKPLKCVCRCCSCGWINDIVISPAKLKWPWSLRWFLLVIHSRSCWCIDTCDIKYVWKSSCRRLWGLLFDSVFPNYLVHNICTTFGKIIKLYDCWLAFSIILCKTRNGVECWKHQNVMLSWRFCINYVGDDIDGCVILVPIHFCARWFPVDKTL